MVDCTYPIKLLGITGNQVNDVASSCAMKCGSAEFQGLTIRASMTTDAFSQILTLNIELW